MEHVAASVIHAEFLQKYGGTSMRPASRQISDLGANRYQNALLPVRLRAPQGKKRSIRPRNINQIQVNINAKNFLSFTRFCNDVAVRVHHK